MMTLRALAMGASEASGLAKVRAKRARGQAGADVGAGARCLPSGRRLFGGDGCGACFGRPRSVGTDGRFGNFTTPAHVPQSTVRSISTSFVGLGGSSVRSCLTSRTADLLGNLPGPCAHH